MEWFTWYFSGLLDVFRQGLNGQWDATGYFTFFAFVFVLFILFPFWLYRNNVDIKTIQEMLRNLEKDLPGEAIREEKDSFLRLDQASKIVNGYTINFKLKGKECQIILYAPPLNPMGRIGYIWNYALWSTVFKLKIDSPVSNFFVKLKSRQKVATVFFRKKYLLDEADISIDNKDAFERVSSYEDLIRLLRSIDFLCVPEFELAVEGNSLTLKVAKVENNIVDIRKYLDFMGKIVEKVSV